MALRAIPRTHGLAPDEAAAHWIVRHDRGDLTVGEQRDFEAWHADPVNAEAFARASAAFDLFDADPGDDPHLKALRQAALETSATPRWPWRAIAAVLVAAFLLGGLAFVGLGRFGAREPAEVAERGSEAPPAAAARSGPREFATGIGERRTIRLPDGTSVTLNTRTRLVEAFGEGRRLVRLLEGQALFEVAHDRNRPFTVEAANRQVTALGTVFEIRVDPGRMQVVLIEGRVAIEQTQVSAAAPGRDAAPAILRPGQEFVAALGAAQQVASVDVARRLLWRDGFVEFDDEPLARAVAEMNRYSERPIVLSDDGVAALRLSGVFRTGSPDRFVNTVSEILPIEARPTPDGHIELSLGSARR